MLVRDWIALWPTVAAGIRYRAPATIEHTHAMCKPFVRSMGRFHLQKLTTMQCADWAVRHPSHVRFVKTVLQDAVLAGHMEESPLAGAPTRRKAPDGRGMFFPTREQVDLVAGAAKPHLADLIVVAADSGMRLTELCELDVRDFEAGPVAGTLLARVRNGKRGRDGSVKPRSVIVRGAGAIVIERLLEEKPAPVGRVRKLHPVLTRANGKAWTRGMVSQGWVPARHAADLPEEFTFHGLRRYYATSLIDAGVDAVAVAIALGHFDARGRPDIVLVQRVYTRPDHSLALARVAAS